MMRKVIIMSGISGSGKSTYVQKLIKDSGIPVGLNEGLRVVSADSYFCSEGEYRFDPSKLSAAHGQCFCDFMRAIIFEKSQLIIVDNTNTTNEEIAPYILGAQAFGYEAEIITLHIPALFAHQRNTHGVSPQGVEAQFNRLQSRKLLPWWRNTDIKAEGFILAR